MFHTTGNEGGAGQLSSNDAFSSSGVLEAIFWKPEFTWKVHEIWVLRDVRYFSMVRNEVNSRASERAARAWQQGGGGFMAEQDRTQRHTLALKHVAYVIWSDIEVKPGISEDPAKYRDQFRRRVQRGQCFARPYLGCREFSAEFGVPDPHEKPIDRTEDLGLMLWDLEYAGDGSGRERRGLSMRGWSGEYYAYQA